MKEVRVAPEEWRWTWRWTAVALVVTSFPYLLGWALSTPEHRFGGFVYNVFDINTYLAKMQQGARGEWLLHISHTPEPHRGALFYLFYLMLGHLAAWSGFSLELTYHLARLACGTLLLSVVYRFTAAFTRRRLLRQIAFLLVALSGGLGWLVTLLARGEWLGSLPLDFLLPEGFAFLVVYALPHIALAQALLLLAFLTLLQALDTRRIGPACWAGLLVLGAMSVVPLYTGVFWAGAGAYLIALALWEQRWPRREVGPVVLAALVPLPLAAYSTRVFLSAPVYQGWLEQNLVRSPHPLHYLAAYGMTGGLAVVGTIRALCRRRRRWLFLLAWVIIVPLLVYLPLNTQRRLVVGAQVPLALLAADGLVTLVRRAQSAHRWRWMAGTVGFMALTPLVLLVGNSLILLSHPEPIFHQRSELEALDWLAAYTNPQEVVLCAFETGNYVPARAGNRVFLGHDSETVRSGPKKKMVARFFNAATKDAWRQVLLREYEIAYVLVGPRERALGAFDPEQTLYLERVYVNEAYQVFRVERRGEDHGAGR